MSRKRKKKQYPWWEHCSPEYMRLYHARRAMARKGISVGVLTADQRKARYGERQRPGKVKKSYVEPQEATRPTMSIAEQYRANGLER